MPPSPTLLRRIVVTLEAFALVAILVFVVMLFANEPSGPSGAAAGPGATIYRANCASCHSADGSGGVGPKLAGRVVTRFPDIEAQIAVVTNGRGGMPSFSGRLSGTEIRQVVEYTRTGLGAQYG